MKSTTKIWIMLGVLAVLTPVGLILPEYFEAGDAWGEWSLDTVKEQTGYEPEGMKKDADRFEAPVPDYHFGEEEDSLLKRSAGYIGSAILGIGVIFLITLGVTKLVPGRQNG